MDQERSDANAEQLATGLEKSLETCQKIVSDYRSKLLTMGGRSAANDVQSDPANDAR